MPRRPQRYLVHCADPVGRFQFGRLYRQAEVRQKILHGLAGLVLKDGNGILYEVDIVLKPIGDTK